MNNGSNIVEESGLRFFGLVSASISHEIKNVLAIINENAGLLEDLVLMTERGQPLDPPKVKALSGKVKTLVRRGDEIVKNMNRFAHSVDEPVERVDLGDVVDLMVRIAQRIADMRRINLDPKAPTETVSFLTKPFLLQNIIWLCMIQAMDMVDDVSTIGLGAELTEPGAQIVFSGLHREKLLSGQAIFSSGEIGSLLGLLGGDCAVKPEAGEIVLRLSDTSL